MSSGSTNFSLLQWIDRRFPLLDLLKEHVTEYYAPKNFNFWYFFGGLAIFVLVVQILSGVWLTMNYNPSSAGAFDSVEYIMRDVPYGWVIRYMHSTGASFFFYSTVFSYVQSPSLRFVQEAQGIIVGNWNDSFVTNYG